MTADEIEGHLFELEYWQQISADIGKLRDLMRAIGAESAETIEADPMAFIGAADLMDSILDKVGNMGEIIVAMQDLVAGRLDVLEKKLKPDG